MSTKKLKRLAMGASAAAMLSSSAHAATSITVAVTPSLANAASDLVSIFQNLYPTAGYDVAVIVDSDANIESSIISGGATGPYDLFLSQSAFLPLDLSYYHPSLVSGAPFPFAEDTLDLYSSASNPVDISAGLPTSAIQNFSSADPKTKDPYGVAANQVLYGKLAYEQALQQGLGVAAPDAVSSYADVEYLGLAYGFAPKSQICTAFNGVEQYEPGSFHHEYEYRRDYFIPIVLTGIQISRTRATDQQTELTSFINFLTGVGTTAGTQGLQQHCYKLPS